MKTPTPAILLVAAEPRLVAAMCRELTAGAFNVLCTATAQEALERFNLNKIDLLILDLDVAPPGGWSAFSHLVPRHPALRIIGLTERSDPQAQACSGLSALAEKPVDVEELVKFIVTMLAANRAATAFSYIRSALARLREHDFPLPAVPDLRAPASVGWGIND